MLKSAVLPIGGKGTRLKSFSDVPKLLTKLNKKPLIDYTLERLVLEKINKVYIISNEHSKEVESYCAVRCKELSIELVTLRERVIKGNFGGIMENWERLPEEFIVVYPDVVWFCDTRKIYNYHSISQSLITLVVRRSDHPFDSDTVKLSPLLNIKSIFSKVTKSREITYEKNDLFGATGIYLMNRKFLELASKIEYKNTELDLFECIEKIKVKENIQLTAFISSQYIKDCGTPERFLRVSEDLKSNIIQSNFQKKQKVLFLDRDGTLIKNKKNNYITSPKEIELNKNIIQVYKKYTAMNYLPVVVTNQPQIAQGKLSLENLDKINCKIQDVLEMNNLQKIFIFLICPHHPHHGFPEEIEELKFICNCRKPNIGLFHLLERNINVDKSKSLMIGDTISDKEFAKNCGIKFLFEQDI